VNVNVDAGGRADAVAGLEFRYQLVDGACGVDHYGLRVAELAGPGIASVV